MPVEIIIAALPTESSTMEELECDDIHIHKVRAFVFCLIMNPFDVCMMGR